MSKPLDQEMAEALERAEQFIENGVDLGFIRMPTVPSDSALQTLPVIRAALARYEAEKAGEPDLVEAAAMIITLRDQLATDLEHGVDNYENDATLDQLFAAIDNARVAAAISRINTGKAAKDE